MKPVFRISDARYAVFQGKNKIRENMNDFTGGITQARTYRADRRNQEQEARRQTIAERRLRMEMAKSEKSPASPAHERPTIKQKQTVQGQEPQKTIREFQSANIQERPVPRADRFKENSSPLKAKRQSPVNQRAQTVNTKSRPLQTARIKKDQGKPS